MVSLQKRPRLNDKFIVAPQACDLCSYDRRVTGNAQIIVAVQPDSVRPRRFSVQQEPPSQSIQAGGEIPRNSLLQTGAQRGINGAGCEGFFNNFHGTPVK